MQLKLKSHKGGDFEKTIVFVFLLLIGMVGIAYAAVHFLQFKVDVQKVGQEEYDRFTLTEKILNVKGCTQSRAVFLLNEIKDPDENCQFENCEVATTTDWAYAIKSKDIETPVCEITSASGEKYAPEFKISESIPIILYDSDNDLYKSAYLLIYGPEGVYSSSYSSGRSYASTLTYSDDAYYDGVKEVTYTYRFKCNAPTESGPGATCIIEKVNSRIQAFTGGGCSKDRVEAELSVGTYSKNTETVKASKPSAWEEWTAENYFSEEVSAGSEINIQTTWKYSYETSDAKYASRDFRNPQMDVSYRVICPAGMIADISDETEEIICTLNEVKNEKE